MSKKTWNILYWVFTVIFCLQMGFTAYAQLTMPDVMSEFTRLGFPDFFRVELCVAKIIGVLVLLIPMIPARVKEWAYCGFAITLVSAYLAHNAQGDVMAKWIWSVATLVLGAISYISWRKRAA